MTVDEQMREYMRGYYEGTRSKYLPRIHYKTPEGKTEPDFRRGYAAARGAYSLIEEAERKRLTALCPHCQGDPEWRSTNAVGKAGMLFGCTICHGTGRRGG